MISRTKAKKEKESVIMSYITEEEEHELDKNGFISILRGGITFNIYSYDVYCYGEINFEPDSDDYATIATFNWLSHLDLLGVVIPANYNYEKHVAYSDTGKLKWYDTVRPEVYAQYVHGVLNKPKRTIIFRNG